MNPLRVLAVTGDPLARAGLAGLVADQEDLNVTGQVGADGDLPELLESYSPDVVVWDLGWDASPALEAVSNLSELGPDIVGLLADNSRVSEARAAGFKGLVRRDVSGSSLQAAVVAVSAGMIVVDSEFDQARPGLGQGPPLPQREPLTPREIEVLELVAQGLPNKAVAHRLGISDHTVKFHVNSVLTKLSAQSRTEAVVNATRLGIILL